MGRVISSLTGDPGPLFVVTVAMHGNEQAGIHAVKELNELFHQIILHTKEKRLKGTFLALIGNMGAVKQNIRYIHQDLNRMWEKDFVYDVLEQNIEKQEYEVKEIHEIIRTLREYVVQGKHDRLFLLDLHTTSSDGFFSICTEDPESIRLANELHAPVVRGLLNGIKGTTLHYFNRNNLGIEATALAFEAGKHDDPLSVKRMIASILNCMVGTDLISGMDFKNPYDELLKIDMKDVPLAVGVVYKYHVKSKEKWEMVPGFKNFDPVKQGQLLAFDEGGEVFCPIDGLILMPLYQKKGRDGFFIVRPLT